VFKNKVVKGKISKERIRKRIRGKISGTSDRPRVYVFKSNKYIYLQAFDDETGQVVAAASTFEKEFRDKNKNTRNIDASKSLGEIMAKRLKQKKKTDIIFDRGIYPYHGCVKALAESMRKGGLNF